MPPQPGEQPGSAGGAGTGSSNGGQWYAVWTRSRHEHSVFEELTRRSVEAFLPMYARWSRWKDRRKRINWPLFPGYVFARFTARDWLRVVRCPGVAAVVSFDGVPAPIPDIEIESIRKLVESELAFDPCPLIKEGDAVEVVQGPLKGAVGRLVRKGAHARLVLSIEIVGRSVSVQVDAADVERV